MTTKKVKLKKSLNALNAKVAVGKQKSLPKLKVILANPYKCENSQLTELESSELKNLIQNEITKSGNTGKDFARENKICLGLASSLRAISSKKTSCVLISQTIKPKFIINQIGYLSREKNSAVPVYVLEDLETISGKTFGVKALVIALPLQLPEMLSKWVTVRTNVGEKLPAKKIKHTATCVTPKAEIPNKTDFNYIYLKKKSNDGERAFVPETVIKAEQAQTIPTKDWTGDYISFSETNADTFDMDLDEAVFEKEKDKVLNALQKMSSKIKTVKVNPNTNVLQQKVNLNHQKQEAKLPNIDREEWDDDSAISSAQYVGLKVHKIQGNPNRKPKKKRKSKKQQSTNV